MAPLRRLARIAVSALPLACGFATAAPAQDRIYAQPDVSGANPYQPSEISNAKLPVAMRGFSVVALRDQQQWLSGQERNQLIFDGQIYWFAGPRDRDIFAAAAHEYAPALAGDCTVTFVDTEERTPGKPEFGLIHQGRLYFFAGEEQRIQFQADPSRYANGDLANDGRCIVSQVDSNKSIVGLPKTVAIVNGLRYLFAGDYERRLFASDPGHYGVQRVLEQAPEDEPGKNAEPPANAGSSNPAKAPSEPGMSKSPGNELEEPEDQHYAMEGYCPVSIHEQGAWIRGGFQNHFDFEGRRYLLAGEKEKKLFAADPRKYVPVLGGDCIVSKMDDGKLAAGSVYHSLVYEGKLYMFAGPDEVRAFKAEPTKYQEAVPGPENPEPPVTPPQEESDPNGASVSEGNALRQGRRSESSGGNPYR